MTQPWNMSDAILIDKFKVALLQPLNAEQQEPLFGMQLEGAVGSPEGEHQQVRFLFNGRAAMLIAGRLAGLSVQISAEYSDVFFEAVESQIVSIGKEVDEGLLDEYKRQRR